jgi:hypothetical protein
MNKVSLKAVISGNITYIVAIGVLAVPITSYLTANLDLAQVSEHAVRNELLSTVIGSTPFRSLHLLVGLSSSALGGYVAARLAKHHELLNALLGSFLGVAVGVYSVITNGVTGNLLVSVLSLMAFAAAATVGGYLRIVQKWAREA